MKLVARLPDRLKDYPCVRANLDLIHASPACERMIAAALPNGPPSI